MTDYSQFKILPDTPALAPAMGFEVYAGALSDVIRTSRPEFAIGVFGSWGTGKTTLMRTIEQAFAADPDVVTAWFTAWRYEREQHLVVPLIDVLREALDASEAPKAKLAAGLIRRAGRAILAGLTLSGRVLGVEATLDPAKVIAQFQAEGDRADEVLSFYHSAFGMLRQAIEEFSANGQRRLVIFVDDLDRCLPKRALEVLESMKLFFDVPGCVFVVGLDQKVAEQAVADKYRTFARPAGGEETPISGREYLKKIFQVPFTLPRVGTGDLQQYLGALASDQEMSASQRDDFWRYVAPHLGFLPTDDAVNFREVKRLVNAYVLQMKMLQARLGGTANPDVVLALQCLTFRPDWQQVYEAFVADPTLFQKLARDQLAAGDARTDELWLVGKQIPLSAELQQYLNGPARPLLDEIQVQQYVAASESTFSSDPRIVDAQAALHALRVAADAIPEDSPAPVPVDRTAFARPLEILQALSVERTALVRLRRVVEDVRAAIPAPPAASDLTGAQLKARLLEAASLADEELSLARRATSLGASFA